MVMLALYWSIMLVCYVLASRLRAHAAKFKFVDKLMSLSVYALVLLMGLRMGADEEVTSSLGSIGVQALLVTVLTAAGSMLGAFAVRKLLHIDRHARPAGTAVDEKEAAREKADVSGAKMSLIILLMVVVGMLLGHFCHPARLHGLTCLSGALGRLARDRAVHHVRAHRL